MLVLDAVRESFMFIVVGKPTDVDGEVNSVNAEHGESNCDACSLGQDAESAIW
jgi:hypothetical protein